MLDSNDAISQRNALPSDPIARLRRQAKQRFIGAAVLVVLAVAAFPFLLDSQPRPVSSSITIDIPKIESKPEAASTAQAIESPQPATSIPTATSTSTPTSAPLAFAPPEERASPPAATSAPETSATAAVKSKYIVQAGSFSEPEKLRATAAKLDQAGIQHYTQAALGKDGTPRTRLRLKGPFATRDEANAAAARVTKLGVAVIVLKP